MIFTSRSVSLILSDMESESFPFYDNSQEAESFNSFPEYDENDPMSFYVSASGNAFSIYTINENLKINSGLLLACVCLLACVLGVTLVNGFWGRFRK